MHFEVETGGVPSKSINNQNVRLSSISIKGARPGAIDTAYYYWGGGDTHGFSSERENMHFFHSR